MTKILDPLLLEEIIQYNDEDNFDRVIAAELAIAQALKMNPILGKVGGETDERVKSLYNRKSKKSLFVSSGKLFKVKKRKIFT